MPVSDRLRSKPDGRRRASQAVTVISWPRRVTGLRVRPSNSRTSAIGARLRLVNQCRTPLPTSRWGSMTVKRLDDSGSSDVSGRCLATSAVDHDVDEPVPQVHLARHGPYDTAAPHRPRAWNASLAALRLVVGGGRIITEDVAVRRSPAIPMVLPRASASPVAAHDVVDKLTAVPALAGGRSSAGCADAGDVATVRPTWSCNSGRSMPCLLLPEGRPGAGNTFSTSRP
jgi:hypothetical protein